VFLMVMWFLGVRRVRNRVFVGFFLAFWGVFGFFFEGQNKKNEIFFLFFFFVGGFFEL
jgi:hypothetical protein